MIPTTSFEDFKDKLFGTVGTPKRDEYEKEFAMEVALEDPLWLNHKIGDTYTMDNKDTPWKIAYYPIMEDAKKKVPYDEPRAVVETPIAGGIDFREVPLRYLTKIVQHKSINP